VIYRGIEKMLSYFVKAILVVLIISGVFGLVYLRSSITAVEYRIGKLEEEKAKALREKKSLIAERASALSIQEVEVRGIRLAGLGFPDRKNFLYVKREGGRLYYASVRGEPIDEQKGGNP